MPGNTLKVTSPSFQEGDWIPKKFTGRAEDISPCLRLEGIAENAKSIAITFDDASHPLFPNYNHWVIMIFIKKNGVLYTSMKSLPANRLGKMVIV